jgi:hypothetical protein
MPEQAEGIDGLAMCNCGNPTRNLQMIYKLLKARQIMHSVKRDFSDKFKSYHEHAHEILMRDFEATHELVMQLLDGTSNFLEHGGSIHGAWLTPSAHAFLHQVEQGDAQRPGDQDIDHVMDAELTAWLDKTQLDQDIDESTSAPAPRL